MKLTSERGWTYYDVAAKAGVSASTLYKYYHSCRMPGVDMLAALADVFDMTMDELIGRSVDKERESERLPSPASEA
jgi:transcriptional regulator with XRE-family HTH domain